jgi:predicted RNase H-like nuclease (RuvC/YqgF family)
MSIFNPWAEVRRLKAQLEAGYETYRVEETQQQAEWAKKAVLLEELERDNTALRSELKQAVIRGANNNFELERKLGEMTAQRNKANNAIKRKDRVIQRREAEIKELELDVREIERKMRAAVEEVDQLKFIKVKFINQNLEVVALKQQVEALAALKEENRKFKEQLAEAVDPRDPKTGRFTKKAKAA